MSEKHDNTSEKIIVGQNIIPDSFDIPSYTDGSLDEVNTILGKKKYREYLSGLELGNTGPYTNKLEELNKNGVDAATSLASMYDTKTTQKIEVLGSKNIEVVARNDNETRIEISKKIIEDIEKKGRQKEKSIENIISKEKYQKLINENKQIKEELDYDNLNLWDLDEKEIKLLDKIERNEHKISDYKKGKKRLKSELKKLFNEKRKEKYRLDEFNKKRVAFKEINY